MLSVGIIIGGSVVVNSAIGYGAYPCTDVRFSILFDVPRVILTLIRAIIKKRRKNAAILLCQNISICSQPKRKKKN